MSIVGFQDSYSYDKKREKIQEICKQMSSISPFYKQMSFFFETNETPHEAILDFVYVVTMNTATSIQQQVSEKNKKILASTKGKYVLEEYSDVENLLDSI